MAVTEARVPLEVALEHVREVVHVMQPWVDRLDVAGSIRWRRSDVGDIDIVCLLQPEAVWPLKDELKAEGAEFLRVSALTWAFRWRDMKVEVYLGPAEEYAMRLLWRTGSKEHNIKLACAAKKMGLAIRKVGVVDAKTGDRLAWRSEEEIFAALDLVYVPPEERKG